MSSIDVAPHFEWQRVDELSQVPPLVATRALAITNEWVLHPAQLERAMPDVEVHRRTDKLTKQRIRSLVLPDLTMLGDEDGVHSVEAMHEGRWHIVTTDFPPEPPSPLTDITFSLRGKGNKYSFASNPDRAVDAHHFEINWRIAQVVSNAVVAVQRVVYGVEYARRWY